MFHIGIRCHIYVTEQVIKSVSQIKRLNNFLSMICITQSLLFYLVVLVWQHLNYINTMSCPIKVNSKTIELTVHTFCNCVLDLGCVFWIKCNLTDSIFHHILVLKTLEVGDLYLACTNLCKVALQPTKLSRDSSMVSTATCYWAGPIFKSRQGRELINFWLKKIFN